MRPANYLLLDAARLCSHITTAWELNPRFDSLFRGASQRTLAPIAPYLFSFPYDTAFSTWYAENGWGDSWGIFITTTASFEECHKHFRKFLIVQTAAGKELFFRFYDPRVLKVFLPCCDASQVIAFFGPVQSFIVEGATPEEGIVFFHNNGHLEQQTCSAADLFPAK